jgi:apolipoprotein N-acyltransferase
MIHSNRWWPFVTLGSGALWALCFARRELVVAPWLALVPLCLLLGSSRPAVSGLLHGLAFWAVSISWIRPTVETYGGFPTWLSLPAFLLLALYLASYTAVFAWLASKLWRQQSVVVLFALPALWVALETIRARMLSGFPWNLAGYAWVGVPGALPASSWVGIYGVSFLVVLVNVALALAIVRRDLRLFLAPTLSVVAFLALAAWACDASLAGPESVFTSAEPGTVRLLQPNTEISTVWNEVRSRADYRQLIKMSDEACNTEATMLVWPESATWPFSYSRDPSMQHDVADLAGRGCPVLLNATTREGEEVFNSALLVGDEQASERYDKRHLVPFGEYVPWWSRLPYVDSIARVAGDFSSGTQDRLLDWGMERIGMAICFEVIFPEEVARKVRSGATLLVTITNDGWYGDSSAPWQHFRAARFRAAENRRILLRAALTGVSGVVREDGLVVEQLGVGQRGSLGDSVRGRSDRSVYNRLPWLVPILCWVGTGFAIFRVLMR